MFRLFRGRNFGLAGPVIAAICLPPMVAVAFSLRAQSTSPQSSTSASASAQSSASDSAAAKAAARRKAFEADEKRLEEGDGIHGSSGNSSGSQTLFVSPTAVNMVRGQRADFGAFDNKGQDVTSKAEWSLSNGYVATLVTGKGKPYIVAKMPGEVTLRARIHENESSCEVKVYDGTSLPPGVVAWQAAKIPGFTPQVAVPAAPSAPRKAPAAQKSKPM